MSTAHANPWKLTFRESLFMDALLAHGLVNKACISIGIKPKDGEHLGRRIRAKMGERTNIRTAVNWARWRDQTSGKQA